MRWRSFAISTRMRCGGSAATSSWPSAAAWNRCGFTKGPDARIRPQPPTRPAAIVANAADRLAGPLNHKRFSRVSATILPFVHCSYAQSPSGFLAVPLQSRRLGDNDFACGAGTACHDRRLGEFALIRSPLVRTLLASAALGAAIGLSGCNTDGVLPMSEKAARPLPEKLVAEIEAKNMDKESPILVRLFKEESELEVWKRDRTGHFALLKTYPICRWSGELGPKLAGPAADRIGLEQREVAGAVPLPDLELGLFLEQADKDRRFLIHVLGFDFGHELL